MKWFLFTGDVIVIGGFLGLAVWLFARRDNRTGASIPMRDEEGDDE